MLCLVMFFVIGVNAMVYAMLRRGNEAGQIDLLRKAADRARRPWETEDQALQELSKRVSELPEGKARLEKGQEQKGAGESSNSPPGSLPGK